MKNALESYGKSENRPKILSDVLGTMPLEISTRKQKAKSNNIFMT